MGDEWWFNAAVRLCPEPDGRDWRAVNLLTRRQVQLGPGGCQVLCAFLGGRSVAAAHRALAERIDVDRPSFDRVVAELAARGLLVTDRAEDHRMAAGVAGRWSRYGWIEAADHHLATFDFPFLDYAEGGWSDDADRMSGYHDAEPDVDVTLTRGGPRLPGPSAAEAIGSLDATFDRVLDGHVDGTGLDARALTTVLAATFGVIGEIRLRHPQAAPRIRRTSPSGGSRHPTEAYVFVADVPGVAPGAYHFDCRGCALERVADLPPVDTLRQLFPGAFRADPRDPVAGGAALSAPAMCTRAVVVFASRFGRNMYRYREPRTFRTVLMDVGHLAATLELVARGLGLHVFSHHGIDDAAIEHLLGLQPLEEGVIYATALGTRRDP